MTLHLVDDDKIANFVVIESKRSEDGGHLGLQESRHAAPISTMTFDTLVPTFGQYMKNNRIMSRGVV